MSGKKTERVRISDEDQQVIMGAIASLEEILVPHLTVITAVLKGDIPMPTGDGRLAEIVKVSQQLEEIKQQMTSICTGLNDGIQSAFDRAYQNALAYYRAVEEAAENNVPGAREIYEELKGYLEE